MKIQICSVENAKYGKKYYIRYKKFLFWHRVAWPNTPEGQTPVTDWYEPLDFTQYFNSEDEAQRYAERNLFPTNYNMVKEYNFD